MLIRPRDRVEFFPYDPVRRTICLESPPLEGVVAEVLAYHYRVDLPHLASCLVARANPTLARREVERCAPTP